MRSPGAASELWDAIDDDEVSLNEADEMMGATDCPEGCFVEPDGVCSHGFESAGLSAGLI